MKNKSKKKFKNHIEKWVDECITNAGGLNTYEEREGEYFGLTKKHQHMHWVLRCLGNPDCEGSKEVLEAIIANREKKRLTTPKNK